MNKLLNLRKQYQIALIVSSLTLLAFCATAFMFTTGRMDIPLGLLTGGILVAGLNFLQGLAEAHDTKNESSTFTIIGLGLRFVLVVTFIVIAGLMWYRWNMPYLNIFCIIGVYTVGIISTIVIYLINKE